MGDQPHAPAVLAKEKRTGTHCTRGCVDPRAGMEMTKNLAPKGFDPRTVQAVTSRYTDCAIPTPFS